MDGATNLWKKSLSAINQREIQCFHSSAGAEQKLKWLLQRSLAKLASSLWIISYSRKSSKLGRLLRFHSIDDSTNEFQISFGNTLPMTRVIDDESGIHFQCAKDIEGHDKTIDIWPLTCPTRTFPPAKLIAHWKFFGAKRAATFDTNIWNLRNAGPTHLVLLDG